MAPPEGLFLQNQNDSLLMDAVYQPARVIIWPSGVALTNFEQIFAAVCGLNAKDPGEKAAFVLSDGL
ncbi:hypothetical protein HU727_005895 [Pseudomonas sp. SWRI153]|uniref:Uncharacterized protein n=1 Tax=Pseudomonas khorasanensis TaxID=2745508 RepID=A0A923JDH8_9PSED|nr:hypothetical protein [Pseudomonas khorasanensis]MBV4485116.1 hypothetical protein [Pseudomonas khorasanensis]